MHMPLKRGILVLVIVAVCLAVYYVAVIRKTNVGDWRIRQGSGSLAHDAESGTRYLDVHYDVQKPDEPVFSYMRLRRSGMESPAAIAFDYQSERLTDLAVVVTGPGGARSRAHVTLEPTQAWRRVRLTPGQFKRVNATPGVEIGAADAAAALEDFDGLSLEVDFYDKSGVSASSVSQANRLKLTRPMFEPAPATAAP
jgi:hypothetical protein